MDKRHESIPLVSHDGLATDHGGTGTTTTPVSSPEPHRPTGARVVLDPKADRGHRSVEARRAESPLHRRAFSHILVFQSLISVAFLAVRENVIMYCTDVLFYLDGGAPKMIDVYAAVLPCLPVFGGILADIYTGRFKMIKIGAFTTLAGLLLLTLDVIPFENWFERSISIEAKRAVFIIGFTVMFLGFAAYGANVGPFAARQVEQAGENAVRTLFHWFFWSTTLGLAVALPLANYVERVVNFGMAFGILTVILVIGIVVLMSLRSNYVEIPPQKDALWRVFKIMYQGIKNRIEARLEDKETASEKERPDGTLDYAKQEHGGSYCCLNVDETKHLLDTLPAFHTVTIYAIVYYFMNQINTSQFDRLNPYLGDIGASTRVPDVTFGMYNAVLLLVFTPVFCYLYPWLEKKGFTVTPLRRIGVGIFLSLLSVTSACLVEVHRKSVMAQKGGTFTNYVQGSNATYQASTLSCLTLIPQFTFGALAEVFVRVAGLEFAYMEGPEHLKGLSTGLYILMSGVGSYILAKILIFLVNAVSHASPWYAAEFNDGHMQYFILVLVCVLLLDLVYLGLISRKYEYAHWRERADRTGAFSDVVGGNDPNSAGYTPVTVAGSTSASDAEGSPRR